MGERQVENPFYGDNEGWADLSLSPFRFRRHASGTDAATSAVIAYPQAPLPQPYPESAEARLAEPSHRFPAPLRLPGVKCCFRAGAWSNWQDAALLMQTVEVRILPPQPIEASARQSIFSKARQAARTSIQNR